MVKTDKLNKEPGVGQPRTQPRPDTLTDLVQSMKWNDYRNFYKKCNGRMTSINVRSYGYSDEIDQTILIWIMTELNKNIQSWSILRPKR